MPDNAPPEVERFEEDPAALRAGVVAALIREDAEWLAAALLEAESTFLDDLFGRYDTRTEERIERLRKAQADVPRIDRSGRG